MSKPRTPFTFFFLQVRNALGVLTSSLLHFCGRHNMSEEFYKLLKQYSAVGVKNYEEDPTGLIFVNKELGGIGSLSDRCLGKQSRKTISHSG